MNIGNDGYYSYSLLFIPPSLTFPNPPALAKSCYISRFCLKIADSLKKNRKFTPDC